MPLEEYGYEAKFSVFTTFLDGTFYRRRQAREGESYEDYCVEMHREMLGVVERLRMEFGGAKPPEQFVYAGKGARTDEPDTPTPTIDYKKWEQFEIDIDNAATSEELEAIVRHYDTFPGKFLTIINAKRQSFKEKNFTDGLE